MRVAVLTLCVLSGAAGIASAASAPFDDDPGYQKAMRTACEKPEGALFPEGVISSDKSALFVATRILNDIYGPQVLKNQTLVAQLHGDRYVINGVVPKNYVGGNATMIMCRSNGKVVFLTHTK